MVTVGSLAAVVAITGAAAGLAASASGVLFAATGNLLSLVGGGTRGAVTADTGFVFMTVLGSGAVGLAVVTGTVLRGASLLFEVRGVDPGRAVSITAIATAPTTVKANAHESVDRARSGGRISTTGLTEPAASAGTSGFAGGPSIRRRDDDAGRTACAFRVRRFGVADAFTFFSDSFRCSWSALSTYSIGRDGFFDFFGLFARTRSLLSIGPSGDRSNCGARVAAGEGRHKPLMAFNLSVRSVPLGLGETQMCDPIGNVGGRRSDG